MKARPFCRDYIGREVEAHPMKKLYEIPELKVSLLAREDIIVTSSDTDTEPDEGPIL